MTDKLMMAYVKAQYNRDTWQNKLTQLPKRIKAHTKDATAQDWIEYAGMGAIAIVILAAAFIFLKTPMTDLFQNIIDSVKDVQGAATDSPNFNPERNQ